MTGGQATLVLSADSDGAHARARSSRRVPGARRIPVIVADGDELSAHEQVLLLLDKASGGATVWRRCS
jgi:DNA polymerase-3 subunit epsilon